MNKVIVPSSEILKYYKDISKNGYALKPEYAARHFGIRTDTVRVKLRELVANGFLVKAGYEFFFPDSKHAKKEQPIVRNKQFDSVETREKKSQAGVAGAEALKRLAFEKGTQRFQVGLAKDSEAIQKRIDAIVAKAEGAGTSYRKNFVYCQGMKRG